MRLDVAYCWLAMKFWFAVADIARWFSGSPRPWRAEDDWVVGIKSYDAKNACRPESGGHSCESIDGEHGGLLKRYRYKWSMDPDTRPIHDAECVFCEKHAKGRFGEKYAIIPRSDI